MKWGVRAHDFGRMEPEALAAVIAEAGFETVQLALTKAVTGVTDFSDVTLSLLDRVRKAFEANRIEISVLGCYVEPALLDREARLKEVQKFWLGLEHAKELGAGLAGTETTRFSAQAECKRETAYENLKDSVLRMTEKAERLGVAIGVETVADHTLHSAALTRRLLDEVNCPRLKIIFDPVNLLISEEDARRQEGIFRSFLETVGSEIEAAHIKDIVFENGAKCWRNIGRGVVRYAPVFRWIKIHKPDLPLLREHFRPESGKADFEAIERLSQAL